MWFRDLSQKSDRILILKQNLLQELLRKARGKGLRFLKWYWFRLKFFLECISNLSHDCKFSTITLPFSPNCVQVKAVKPDVLLGLSGVGGIFNKEVQEVYCYHLNVLILVKLNINLVRFLKLCVNLHVPDQLFLQCQIQLIMVCGIFVSSLACMFSLKHKDVIQVDVYQSRA